MHLSDLSIDLKLIHLITTAGPSLQVQDKGA
jgi:hypothetical protein